MNGAGNDFVVIDARKSPISLSEEQIRSLSSRDNQITKGCDQLLILEKSPSLTLPLKGVGLGGGADVFMRIYNADGGEVDACGNATRCIADMLYKELGRLPVTIQTNAAILQGVKKHDDYILVDMGAPKFDWQDIPLTMPIEKSTRKVVDFVNMPELGTPTFVSMGNPHVVFFVENLPEDDEVARIGSKIENFTEVFPERVNVSFAKTHKDFVIFAKTWERGAGLTKACGTGACAMLAAAKIQKIEMESAFVKFTSYEQMVHTKSEENGHILLGGAVETEFEGTVEI